MPSSEENESLGVILPDVEKTLIKRIYLNIDPGEKGKTEELEVRKILARYPGPYAAFGYNKASGLAKKFGLTVSADEEMLASLESLLGKKNVFVKVLEN